MDHHAAARKLAHEGDRASDEPMLDEITLDELIEQSERLADLLDSGEVRRSGILPAERLRGAVERLSDALAALDDAALHISHDGRTVRLPDGVELCLATRRAPRLLLLALADARRRAPGVALDVPALVTAGWPGERVAVEAAATRVYTAVCTLRRMGLGPLLLRRDDGYLLDPDMPLLRG